jgi:hypothetical protein
MMHLLSKTFHPSVHALKYDYPKLENFQGHLFWDTMNIQNLIWSICLGIMVAIFKT